MEEGRFGNFYLVQTLLQKLLVLIVNWNLHVLRFRSCHLEGMSPSCCAHEPAGHLTWLAASLLWEQNTGSGPIYHGIPDQLPRSLRKQLVNRVLP